MQQYEIATIYIHICDLQQLKDKDAEFNSSSQTLADGGREIKPRPRSQHG